MSVVETLWVLYDLEVQVGGVWIPLVEQYYLKEILYLQDSMCPVLQWQLGLFY